jgi:hypothetical protein
VSTVNDLQRIFMLTRTARRAFAPRNLAAAALVVLALAGVAWAAVDSADVADNSILSIDLKNGAVQGVDIKNGTITAADIRDESLNGDKIENRTIRGRDLAENTVTGTQIDESTLAAVPTATNATQLGGISAAEYLTRTYDTQFVSAKLAFNQTKLLASNGAVSLFARCRQDSGNDIAEVIAATSTAGAFMIDTSPSPELDGGPAPTDFLNPDTLADDRILLRGPQPTGTIGFTRNIDEGYVISADGRYLGIDGETTALGTNVLGSACVVAGYVSRGTIA